MADRTETRTGVSADDVPLVTALFQKQKPPPTSVTSTPDGNGTFTVTATWKDSGSG